MIALIASLSIAHAGDVAKVGAKAPDFTLTDTEGNTVKLSDNLGKVVVLEWFNPGCPFVVYAHDEGPLEDMADSWADKGVVWLAVNSGAPGKQGHGVDTNNKARSDWGMDYPVLVDEDGKVGKMYGAKTTPQMVVIDDKGVIQYMGALDNAPMGKADGDRVDYVGMALDAVKNGGTIKTTNTKSYGCSVKYGS